MDPQALQEAFDRLEQLEERMNYKIRPRSGLTLGGPNPRDLEERLRDLAAYTMELKDVVRELLVGLGVDPTD